MRNLLYKYLVIFYKQSLRLDPLELHIRNFIKYRFLEKFSANWVVAPIFLFLAWLIICFDWPSSISKVKEISSLFFSIGTITGSMLAIVFAFTSQLISRSNEAFSARFYKSFARDTRIDLSYIVLGSITIVEFGLGIIADDGDASTARNTLLRVGLLLLLLSIIILYYSYTRLIKLMNNDQLVLMLAKKYKKEIDEMNYLAKRISRILNIKHNKTSDKDKRAM